ncbi:DoxX family protein [Azohydromonas lata]|uniref:DoxX family protein n=1 Tax=Azohydromonas lata TaxID=45677 RepID=A0ABU5IIM1_9BURK|nr:DoxX family protein [Azohydromonas lata]MDZ5458694.1 DoxX family protein [Azohydromonas lata]
MTVTTTAPLAVSSPGEDAGKLVLRVALGVLILLHGIAKIVGGPGFIMGLVAKAGLPAALGYGVYIGEVVAPLLLIVGLYTRAAALIVFINMLVAIGLVHMGQIGQINKQGGWELELQGMYLFGALAVALLGAGRYSMGGLRGRLN